MVLLDALFDPVDEVRWTAMNYAGLFQTFPPEAEKILRRAAGADDGWLRKNSLYLLPTAIGKKALPVIEKAKQDRLFLVRHSAHIAAFKLDGRFEEYLRYLIRLRDDPDGVLAPEPDDPKLRDEEGQSTTWPRSAPPSGSSSGATPAARSWPGRWRSCWTTRRP